MKKKKKLPDFRKMTDDEVGEWIKTHDLTDYLGELEIVDERADPDVILPIRLSRSTVQVLRRIARKTGVRGASSYARMILTEHIQKAA